MCCRDIETREDWSVNTTCNRPNGLFTLVDLAEKCRRNGCKVVCSTLAYHWIYTMQIMRKTSRHCRVILLRSLAKITAVKYRTKLDESIEGVPRWPTNLSRQVKEFCIFALLISSGLVAEVVSPRFCLYPTTLVSQLWCVTSNCGLDLSPLTSAAQV